jgi:4-hydroxy-tetrahydrodipicolinate synthase
MNSLRGTGVALITPFDNNKAVDYPALEKLVNYCIENGVNYLVVQGTTGESATLDKQEKEEVLKAIIGYNQGKLPIVLGLGGNNTAALVADLQSKDFSGVDAILSVSPYYNKPTQEGIYQHYKALAEVSPLPIILYNVPGRTSSNVSADTTLRLARDFKNIVAIKEASGNMEQIMQIAKYRPEGFLLISGDDNLTFPMIALGGDGVISVSGQAFPSIFCSMVQEALSGNYASALTKHYQLFDVTKMLFEEGNPGGVKFVLQEYGIVQEHMRQPLWPISEALKSKLKAELLTIKL